jgi:hypothetical protein
VSHLSTGSRSEQAERTFADRAEQRRAGRPNRIPYPFDATPKRVKELVKQGSLEPIDVLVLDELLRWRLHFVASCWCAVATIADNLGYSSRTVSRSLGRLEAAGVIDQRRVPKPDPDEPRNKTGWRITFLWLAPPDYQPAGRPPGGRPRRREEKVSPLFAMAEALAAAGMTAASSGEMTPASSPEMTRESSNLRAGASNRSDGVESNETPSSSSEGDSPRAREDPAREATTTTNHSRALPEGESLEPAGASPGAEPDPKPAAEADQVVAERQGPELPAGALEAIALAEAEPKLGAPVAAEIRDFAPRLDRELDGRWDWFLHGLAVAAVARKPIDNAVSYAMGAAIRHPMNSYRAKGGIDGPARAALALVRQRAMTKAAEVARQAAAVQTRAAPEPKAENPGDWREVWSARPELAESQALFRAKLAEDQARSERAANRRAQAKRGEDGSG